MFLIFFVGRLFSHLDIFQTAKPSSRYKPKDNKLFTEGRSNNMISPIRSQISAPI